MPTMRRVGVRDSRLSAFSRAFSASDNLSETVLGGSSHRRCPYMLGDCREGQGHKKRSDVYFVSQNKGTQITLP